MKNIILIGMPGAGKTTIGMDLCDTFNISWIDTDELLEEKIKMKLIEYINLKGAEEFNRAEEEVICSLNLDNHIISTGGSVIYSDKAMQHLKKLGKIFYLKVPYSIIEERLNKTPDRGVVNSSGGTLKDLYKERIKKYEYWADVIVDCENKDLYDICREILMTDL